VDQWIRTVEEVVLPAVKKNRKTDQPRVGIAILDTGVDATHPQIRAALDQKRIVARGFPGSLDPLHDDDGHGSYGASVLLQMAPDATIYVARIFGKEETFEPADVVKVGLNLRYSNVLGNPVGN
jgi:subtilisin family serine protease